MYHKIKSLNIFTIKSEMYVGLRIGAKSHQLQQALQSMLKYFNLADEALVT